MTDLEATVPATATGEFNFPTFHGKGGEFFKIWIVNVLLTILTLGIYSAWAKVRTLKYMYGATELAEARFGFHGDAVAILKGRIIASVIGFLYISGASLSIFVSIIGVLLIYFLFPFLFVKSLKFRLGNTSYRNLRFAFRGTIDQAYKIWFKYTIPFLAYMIINALLVTYIEGLKTTPNTTGAVVASIAFGVIIIGFAIYSLVVLPKLYNKAINYIYDSTYYAGNKFNLNSPLAQFKKMVFWPITMKYIVLIVGFIVLLAGVGTVVGLSAAGAAKSEPGSTAEAMKMILFMGPVLTLFYFALFCFAIYTVYLIKDYVWNRLALDPSQPTKSVIKYGEYLKISLVNLLFTILTIGFYFPWAKMRSKKYLVEKRGIQIDDFDKFTSSAEENINALGEEAVDAFDFDIEIGL